ncbi:MAG: hypothetical protein II072_05670 [Clostridia bacterium]|nr:hypothetical protein [Clostridia bacterium]MBQ2110729.1 hypothetical protein [Clostridia bacterium]MBQ5487905.1 hypothetical protein [Clostridia bacterium]
MKATKKFLRLLPAVLALAMVLTACTRGTGRTGSTASPTAGPTDVLGLNTREPAASGGPNGSGEPLTSPDMNGTGSPATTGEPMTTGEPLTSPGVGEAGDLFGSIDGFTEGKVLDPSEIPEVTEMLGREFPEHTIQSVTEETYRGMGAYRVTLQGDGELARLVYVLGDGTILIPGGMPD